MFNPAVVLAATLLAQSTAPLSAPVSPARTTTSAPCPQIKFWPQLRQDLKQDFRRLLSTESAVIISGGGAGAVISNTRDDDVDRWAVEAGATNSTRLGRVLGSGYVQAPAILATWMTARLLEKPCGQQLGSDLARAATIDFAIIEMLKYSTQRQRPHDGDQLSFPSGHTASTFALAAIFDKHFGWKVGLPAYGLATYTGWSRLRDDKHWLSDVVFGAALGFAVGRSVGQGRPTRGWTLLPVAAKGGVGFVVVRRPAD